MHGWVLAFIIFMLLVLMLCVVLLKLGTREVDKMVVEAEKETKHGTQD